MKKYITFILLLFQITGCKTPVPVTEIPVKTEIIVHERLIPVPVPVDSLTVSALFECDSSYNVLLKTYNEEKTKRVESGFGFGNNLFNYKANTVRDTLYVVGKDSTIYRDVPFKVPVPYEVNKIKGWQYFLIWCGVISLAVLLVLIIIRLIKRKN